MNKIIQGHKRLQDIQDDWIRKDLIRKGVELEFAQKSAIEKSF